LYKYYCNNQEFNINLFKESASEFFDKNPEIKLHDRFFNNFTILWQILIKNGSFFFAEQIWQLAVQIAKQWERLNRSKNRVHKGAAYYFWAITCILKEDLEKGFLLMHQALAEDRYSSSREPADTPAYAFVKLDYKQQEQYFRNKVLEIAKFLEQRLKLYQSSRNGTLTLDQLKSKFLDNIDIQDPAFLFVYEIFHIKKLLSESEQGLTQNVYGTILLMQNISTFILLIDNIIKHKYNINDIHKQDPIHLMEYLLMKLENHTMDLTKLKEINKRGNTDLEAILLDLLNSRPIFKNSKLMEIENDISIAYVLRNPAAHRIRDRPFVHQNFNKIVDRLFNIFFLAVEKLYIETA
jgi:hypothetical protein